MELACVATAAVQFGVVVFLPKKKPISPHKTEFTTLGLASSMSPVSHSWVAL